MSVINRVVGARVLWDGPPGCGAVVSTPDGRSGCGHLHPEVWPGRSGGSPFRLTTACAQGRAVSEKGELSGGVGSGEQLGQLVDVVDDGVRALLLTRLGVSPRDEHRRQPVLAGTVDVVVAVADHDGALEVRTVLTQPGDGVLDDVGLPRPRLVLRGAAHDGEVLRQTGVLEDDHGQ